MCGYDIDFVVLWVDTNDPAWQRTKARFTPGKSDDVEIIRYQNWDNIKYWFRAVAMYAPWVRKIHFVTCGQIPDWLAVNNPKLNLVNHVDYMPNDALPTFNSSAIEVGMHKIPDLAEHFVYFNDDVFLTAPVTPEYFYKKGVPVDMPGFLRPPQQKDGNVFSSLLYNNSMIIKKHFTKSEIMSRHTLSYFNPTYGKSFVRTMRYAFGKSFPGFVIPHLSTAYTKEDFKKVWEHEDAILLNTQYHRFRSENDVTHFLIRNWRMCEGAYVPKKSKGKYFSVDSELTAEQIASAIINKKYPEICINEVCTGELFENVKHIINNAFAEALSEPCEYEK